MSDYDEWLRGVVEEEEAYLRGGRPPEGHPDAFAEEQERKDLEGRYYDAPHRAPAREDDAWYEPEDIAA